MVAAEAAGSMAIRAPSGTLEHAQYTPPSPTPPFVAQRAPGTVVPRTCRQIRCSSHAVAPRKRHNRERSMIKKGRATVANTGRWAGFGLQWNVLHWSFFAFVFWRRRRFWDGPRASGEAVLG